MNARHVSDTHFDKQDHSLSPVACVAPWLAEEKDDAGTAASLSSFERIKLQN